MALTNKLEAIGDAIRNKNGETDKYKLDEMPAAIGRIPTGEPTPPWTRPSAWPDLDSLSIAEGEQVVYLTIDNRDRDALLALNTNISGYTVDIGTIENKEFQVIDTFKPNIVNWDPPSLDYFSNIDIDYLVVRITSPTKDISYVSYRSPKNKDGLSMNNRQQCSVLEAYYALPHGTTCAYCACFPTQHVKCINCSFTNCYQMFQDARGLEYIEFENCDMSHVTTYRQMLWNCQSLIDTSFLKDLDCTSCTTIEAMFYQASSLQSVNLGLLPNTGKIENASRLFYGCSSLRELKVEGFDTSSVTNISTLIQGISSLKKLDLSSLDITGATQTALISGNAKIMRFIPPKGLNQSIILANGCLIYKPYILELFNALETVDTAPTLSIGTIGLSTLTDDEKAIATDKGWKLA